MSNSTGSCPGRARASGSAFPSVPPAPVTSTRVLGKDLGSHITAGEMDLVGTRAAREHAEVHIEVLVERHRAVLGDIYLQQSGLQVRVKLVVPRAVQRVGDVQPSPIHRELHHLRPAVQNAAPMPPLLLQATQPELTVQPRVGTVRDVVLAQVPVKPASRSRGTGRPWR